MVYIDSLADDQSFLKKSSGCKPLKCYQAALKGVRVPVYCFGSLLSVKNVASDDSTHDSEGQRLLDTLLLAQYEDRVWKNSTKYDVTACQTKVTKGSRRFLVQLNEHWKTNLSVELDELHDKLLFCVTSGDKPESELISSARASNGAYMITVNANPVEYGHIFLTHCSSIPLPTTQMQFASSLDTALKFAAEVENFSFRAFYDRASYSGCVSADFQACYFAAPLPVEQALSMPISRVPEQKGLFISKIAGYPMKVLLFQVKGNLETLVKMVSKICLCLIDQNTPFSLLISDSGRKIFLFPQASSATTDLLSAFECSGHFILNNKNDYDDVSEDVLVKRLSAVSIDEARLKSIEQLCCNVANKLLP